MNALFILIGISILIAAAFLIAFLWSVSSGQYDDDYTPSVRMLFDDSLIPMKKKSSKQKTKNAGRKISL
ncbi:MAG: cytochrome oxidase maturation protein Cbb3 [Ferruginibacter sp.]|nr:cytochrome oxidase maturation protein Cbb3 [Ferruginibacter sp.]